MNFQFNIITFIHTNTRTHVHKCGTTLVAMVVVVVQIDRVRCCKMVAAAHTYLLCTLQNIMGELAKCAIYNLLFKKQKIAFSLETNFTEGYV